MMLNCDVRSRRRIGNESASELLEGFLVGHSGDDCVGILESAR